MPMMMAPVIAGLVWYYPLQLDLRLVSTGCCRASGILGRRPRSWARTDTAMSGIVIVDVWQWTPLITLITLAGLKRVPRDQLEANMVDGAGEMRNFFAITLPNLYPFLLIAILLRFMDNFRFIDAILILTGGGPARRHQDPAGLPVRRLVPVLQARARRRDRAHSAASSPSSWACSWCASSRTRPASSRPTRG